MIHEFEEVVALYLTADPAVFLSEQYHLVFHDEVGLRESWPDIVALNLKEHCLYLVEVTFTKQPANLRRTLVQYYSDMSHIRRKLTESIGLPDDWKIRPWCFVRRSVAPKLIAGLAESVEPRITYLELAAFPREYGRARKLGKEPEKPYSGLPLVFS